MSNKTSSKIRCEVYDADLDSAKFGELLGSVELHDYEARHFSASGSHNANVSLTDAQQKTIGLDHRFDNYVTISEAN